MLSLKALSIDSFPIVVITKAKSSTTLDTIFYTDFTEELSKNPSNFEDDIAHYLEDNPILDGSFELKKEYLFQVTPFISQMIIPKKNLKILKDEIPDDPEASKQQKPREYYINKLGKKSYILNKTSDGDIMEVSNSEPRFVNYLLGSSNSGKSYQIAQLIRKYLIMFPNNLVVYASANNLDNDDNFVDIKHKIKELNIMKLESIIDYKKEEFRNSLWIFDDIDSSFSVSYEDLDEGITAKDIENMSVKEKSKLSKALKDKTAIAEMWVNKTIQSFLTNGRKMNQSIFVVGHKPFEGRNENLYINEASAVTIFPAKMKKNVLKTFIENKLSFNRQDAKELMELKWLKYSWLLLSHRTSTPFIITKNIIKLYD